jgi:hypothetical protein
LIEEERKKAKLASAAELDTKNQELTELQEVLKVRDEKLAEAQKAQAELIKKQRELDDAKRELELTVETRVQEGLSEVRSQAKREAEDGLRLKVMEKDQTIASMQQKIEELKQKAEQGSQQLQGEVLRILVYKNADSEPWKTLKTELTTLETDIKTAIEGLITGILGAERGVISHAEKREEALLLLVSFLMSFASRTGTRDRLHIFTTNYDRLIEFGAEVAGIRLVDRFIGSLSPLFRASRLDIDLHYNPPGIRGEPRYLEGVARFTKLHGSLDWVDEDRQVRRIALPFGAKDHKPFLPENAQNVLIYPNDAKDRETTDYPYVELHRDFAAAVCRPNSVLVTYGYSFGDDHINRVIRDMLTIPSTHLVALNHGDTGGRLTKFYNDSKRISQITLVVGSHFGNLSNLVDYYLPKPAIDRASIRMAELLRARGITDKSKDESQKDSASLQDPAAFPTESEEL